jgi:hypothetical protein
MIRPFGLAGVLCLAVTAPLLAQHATRGAADGLLDRLVGRWRMTGSVRGRPAAYTLEAARVLQGRFVELHMVDDNRPPGYEARVFVGADTAGGRVIAHWLDNFGAAYSVPHATGEVRGDTLLLAFPYPSGAFRDTFTYDSSADAWHFRLETADSTGAWRRFADYDVRRRRDRAPGAEREED